MDYRRKNLESVICQRIADKVTGDSVEDKIRRQAFAEAISEVHDVFRDFEGEKTESGITLVELFELLGESQAFRIVDPGYQELGEYNKRDSVDPKYNDARVLAVRVHWLWDDPTSMLTIVLDVGKEEE